MMGKKLGGKLSSGIKKLKERIGEKITIIPHGNQGGYLNQLRQAVEARITDPQKKRLLLEKISRLQNASYLACGGRTWNEVINSIERELK